MEWNPKLLKKKDRVRIFASHFAYLLVSMEYGPEHWHNRASEEPWRQLYVSLAVCRQKREHTPDYWGSLSLVSLPRALTAESCSRKC